MNDEQVDIVDKNNNVLYSALKSVAHQKGLLHRTIIAEVINRNKHMLLVKQASHKQDVGQFVSPVGGHIKSGESELDALRREALEEVGLKDFTHKRIGQAIFNRRVRDKKENHLFIVYEIFSEAVPTLNDESVEYRYFLPKDLKKILKNDPSVFGAALHFVIDHFYSHIR